MLVFTHDWKWPQLSLMRDPQLIKRRCMDVRFAVQSSSGGAGSSLSELHILVSCFEKLYRSRWWAEKPTFVKQAVDALYDVIAFVVFVSAVVFMHSRGGHFVDNAEKGLLVSSSRRFYIPHHELLILLWGRSRKLQSLSTATILHDQRFVVSLAVLELGRAADSAVVIYWVLVAGSRAET